MGALATAAAATSSGTNPTFLILIVVIFVGFYFLMIRPQRQRQQRIQQQQNTIQPGSRVRTTAGMYATVVSVDDDDVVLEIAPGIEARFMKRAIMDVLSDGDEPPADVTEDEEAEDVEQDDTEHEDSGPEPVDVQDSAVTEEDQTVGKRD